MFLLVLPRYTLINEIVEPGYSCYSKIFFTVRVNFTSSYVKNLNSTVRLKFGRQKIFGKKRSINKQKTGREDKLCTHKKCFLTAEIDNDERIYLTKRNSPGFFL